MTPESYDNVANAAEYAELWREWGIELPPEWRDASCLLSMAGGPAESWAELRVAFLYEGNPGAEESQLLQKIVQAMGLTWGRDAGAWPVAGRWRECVPGTPAIAVVLGASLWTALSGRGEFEADRGRFHPSDRPGLRFIPTWPPSHLLRHPEAKKIVWEDMKLVVRGLAEST